MSCPRCGADVVLRAHTEHQGVRPHGGYVTYVECDKKTCDCEWADADWNAMQHRAATADRPIPEYDPVLP